MTITRINKLDQYIVPTESEIYFYPTGEGLNTYWRLVWTDAQNLRADKTTNGGATWTNGSNGSIYFHKVENGDTYASVNSSYLSSGSFHLVKRGETIHLVGSLKAKVALGNRPKIATIASGYRPADTAYIHMNDDPTHYLIINTSGSIVYSGALAAGSSRWFSGCYVTT